MEVDREVAEEGIARGPGNNGAGEERPLEPIRFRGQENKFSNFCPCSVEVFGQEFSASEVAYKWRKAMFMGEAGVAAGVCGWRERRNGRHLGRLGREGGTQ